MNERTLQWVNIGILALMVAVWIWATIKAPRKMGPVPVILMNPDGTMVQFGKEPLIIKDDER